MSSRFHRQPRRGQSRQREIGLLPVPLPTLLSLPPADTETAQLIHCAQDRIQAFQDRWDQPQIEQFVASDYELVYVALRWLRQSGRLTGNRMLEFGCGFAVVSALASRLGMDVFGIEAERRLLDQAKQTVRDFNTPVELVHGNFLPRGAESLSMNPEFPSLGHAVPCGYETMGLDLDDFALVFGYPWPGEEKFHEAVFARYGAPGAHLLLFCGPYDLRLWQKPDDLA